jgi:hypothetical protein
MLLKHKGIGGVLTNTATIPALPQALSVIYHTFEILKNSK